MTRLREQSTINTYSGERDQAKVRLIFLAIIILYCLTFLYFGKLSLTIVIIYCCTIPLALGLFVWSTIRPSDNPLRHVLSIIADLGTTTLVMSLSGEAASPLFLVYLWTTFGNGFRFGRTYLYISMGFSILGFSLVLFLSPFWSQQHFLGAGLLLTLSVLPLYIARFLKKLQNAIEMAQNASKEKSQFLASMSHEIRTPLNGVVGMSELLSSTQMSLEQKEFIATIQSSAKTLLALIENILDISKIEAGKTELEAVDFDLHELLNSITKMLFPHAAAKGLNCKLRIAADVPYRLNGDSIHLRQILINLIGNAIKFTEEGSIEVNLSRISTRKNPVQFRFEIIDTGIGIDTDAQETIFETFAQADKSTNRKFGGTGLGAAISKKLVSLMGGSIGVISDLGKGSTFWFELQYERQAESLTPAARREISFKSSRSPRLLLIATLGDSHTSMVQFLEEWNFKWEYAKTQEEALVILQNTVISGINSVQNIVNEKPFNVALVDHECLEGDISSFFQQLLLNPASKQTSFILVSHTKLDRQQKQAFLSAGFFCILESPIEKKLLFNALHATIRPDQDSASTVSRLGSVKSATGSNLKPLKILVGEDNPTNQKVIGAILKYAGHHVDIVNNGLEVLEAINNDTYDILIIDMHMPEMDGLEATRALQSMQEANNRTPIIMLTADATTTAIKASEEAGADVYLSKPFETEKLLNTIASLTSNKDENIQEQQAESAPGTTITPEHTLDYERLGELASLTGNKNFIHDLVKLFLTDTDKNIEKIVFEIQQQNLPAIQDYAHAITGSANSIGANSIAIISAKIQDEAFEQISTNIPALCTLLRECYEVTKEELSQYLEKPDT